MIKCDWGKEHLKGRKVEVQIQLIEDSQIKAKAQGHFCSPQCLKFWLQSACFDKEPWANVRTVIGRPIEVLEVPKPGEPEGIKVIHKFEPEKEERERGVKIRIQMEGTFKSIESVELWLGR